MVEYRHILAARGWWEPTPVANSGPCGQLNPFVVALAVASSILFSSAAHADVKISSAATANMTCANGICAPTAPNAVLNVGDLENLLASGNVEVTTTGSGVQANNIGIDAALTWSSTNTLALDAYQSVLVEKPASIAGLSGLSITINDGGTGGYFGFGAKGHVTFANLSSALRINGAPYTLEGDIKSLASAIAGNSAGNYALANDYDADKDHTYQNAAIPTEFSGNFEGLGNTISNLSMNGTGDVYSPVGLFAQLALNNEAGGAVENINLRKLYIGGAGFDVGGLVGINGGTISGVSVSGYAQSSFSGGADMGLLVGVNGGTIARSSAVGTVTAGGESGIGGLAGPGGQSGSITQSWANVSLSGGTSSVLGGLAAGSAGPISESYATATITDNGNSVVGGLVGENVSTIAQSYSTTALRNIRHKDRDAGGLIGVDYSQAGSNTSDYWDTSTSHIRNLKQGAGTPKNDPGITGLTTEQLQSGLPSGFDPTVWAEDPKINGGLPYLINNPPRKD